VFGILRVVNFAHGCLHAGRLSRLTAVALTGWFWPALLIVPPVVGLLARCWKRPRCASSTGARRSTSSCSPFGLALILEESIRVLYGPTAKGVEPPALLQGAISVGGLVYPRYRLFLVGLSLAVGVRCCCSCEKTRAGLVIRAVAQNSEMADCLGPTSPACARWCSVPPVRSPASAAWRPAPMTTAYLGMGIGVIVDAFVVVVIGGLGASAARWRAA